MGRLLTPVEARHYTEAVSNYRPAHEVFEQFRASNFAVIAGPAGGGKDTLRNSLLARYPETYLPILSTTTRPPRPGETNGQDYHFCTISQFNEYLMKREFLQVALVHNQQLSGLHINEVRKLNAWQTGLSILVVHTQAELRRYHHNIKTIFLTPPSHEILLERINASRMLEEAEVKRRLSAARTEITYALNQQDYYCIASNTVEQVTQAAHLFLQQGVRSAAEEAAAHKSMQDILTQLQ